MTGFVFAACLVVLQLAVLDAVCEWCVANDALLAVLAGPRRLARAPT